MLKKIFVFMVNVLLLGITYSCNLNTESIYSTKPTKLNVEMAKLMDIFAYIRIRPEDSRCYYFYQVKSTEEVEKMTVNEAEYMQNCIDSLYCDYQAWHEIYEKSSAFIADFASYSFYYGNSSKYFLLLKPNTEYQLLSFSVDPKKRKALGDLQRYKFTTTPLNTTYVSPMVLDFQVEMYDYKGENVVQVVTRPLVVGELCLDPYFYVLESEEYIEKKFGSILAYVEYYEKELADNHGEKSRPYLFYDIREHDSYYVSDPSKLDGELFVKPIEEGDRLIAIAAPFFSTWNQCVFIRRFTFKRGEKLPYDHNSVIN